MTKKHLPIALLRNVSTRRIIKALEREGFSIRRVQRKPACLSAPGDRRRVLIHYHTGSETLPPYVLRNLLIGTGWTEDDFRRLGLGK